LAPAEKKKKKLKVRNDIGKAYMLAEAANARSPHIYLALTHRRSGSTLRIDCHHHRRRNQRTKPLLQILNTIQYP
jgi:hypothetical protein